MAKNLQESIKHAEQKLEDAIRVGDSFEILTWKTELDILKSRGLPKNG